MGIDALDIAFRIEKSFHLKISRAEMDFIYGADKPRHEQVEPKAGEIHDRLCELLKRKGMDIPEDSWQRIQKCIAEGIGFRGLFTNRLRPDEVKRESLLVKDLGAS